VQKKGVPPPKLTKPALSPETSIYKPGVELQGFREGLSEEELERLKKLDEERNAQLEKDRHARLAAAKLDPDPRARILWERDMVIKSIQRRGRMSKEDKIAKTERQSLFKSIDLATTPKKMTKLTNQIAGKTVEEALVQLRFSGKRVARDIAKGLQIARDEAIAKRGMGLGSITAPPEVKLDLKRKEGESDQDFEARQEKAEAERLKMLEERLLPRGTFRTPKTGSPISIELKDGRRKNVYDPTEMYIDQAWAGKGIYTKSLEFRARGMTNILRHRTASKFSLPAKPSAVQTYIIVD
jgi:ribosomal protein L22